MLSDKNSTIFLFSSFDTFICLFHLTIQYPLPDDPQVLQRLAHICPVNRLDQHPAEQIIIRVYKEQIKPMLKANFCQKPFTDKHFARESQTAWYMKCLVSRNLNQLLILDQTRSRQKCLSKYCFCNCPLNLNRKYSLCILLCFITIISPLFSLFLVTLLFFLANLCFMHIQVQFFRHKLRPSHFETWQCNDIFKMSKRCL